MPAIRVHQFHSGSAVGDAVTPSMLLIRDALRARGIESDIFVAERVADPANPLKLVGELRPSPDDVLLIHHSTGHDVMEYIAALDCNKVLIYHGITPPEDSRRSQDRAVRGYQQLAVLRDMVSGAIAHSDDHAEALCRRGFAHVATLPLLRDFKAVRHQAFNQHLQHFDAPAHHLLFVGPIAENQGQAELIAFMAAYADSFDYPLCLTLAGHSDQGGAGHDARLQAMISRYGLQDRVTLAGDVSDSDLYGLYRASDAYVSLGRRDGFGVPLVEAMAFDLPIVAYDAAAISSTLGDSGVRISDTRPETIARALAPVLMSRKARRKVLSGQRRRLEDFDAGSLTDALFAFLAPFLSAAAEPSRRAAPKAPKGGPVGGRHYVMQGPCETSYSLAIVNRSLATALDRTKAGSVRFEPMEGHGDYAFDAIQAEAFPDLIRMLEAPSTHSADAVITIRNTYPTRPAGLQGDFRLLNLAWEETELSRAMVDLMEKHLDGVLVATSFVRNVLRNSGLSIPIGINGHGVDHRSVTRQPPPRKQAANAPFRFLHVSSGLARKGIEELLLAYVTAFTAADAVELVIKTYDNETNVVRSLYRQVIEDHPNAPIVQVIAGSMQDADIQTLYASADAVVLPSRGEGFNLPAAEAMLAKIPIVVTGFSGHTDFCDDTTAWLIDFDFEPSKSHLRSSNANWVRARAIDLAAVMRRLYNRDPALVAERDKKRAAAFKSVSSLTWARCAQKTDQFVDTLMADTPSKPRLKVAWVSTWNTRCGIASYSEFLVPNLSPNATDITVFGNREAPNTPDAANVVRNWDLASAGIAELTDQLVEGGFDAVVIQYNFGFYSLDQLARMVSALRSHGIDSYVFFHKTESSVVNGRTISIADHAGDLRGATRLVVHTVDDVNRLKSYGLVDNVVQIPHGLPASPDFDPAMVKRFLGMRDAFPLIASYGFLLPHKGISELIMAFGLLRADHPKAKLLLLNGQYPGPQSAEEARLCRKLIADLGLESDVVLITDYMDNEDVTLMLHAADGIVYPYQDTEESASGAVRFGLAALRPVAVTPLPIFKDVSEYCYTLPGTSALEIAEGLRALLADEATRDALVARQKAWLQDVNWQQIGKRLTGMMVGLHNDSRAVRVVPDLQEPKPGRTPAPPVDTNDMLSQLSEIPFVRLACQRILGRDPELSELGAVDDLRGGRLSRDAFLTQLTAQAQALRSQGHLASTQVVSFADIASNDHKGFVRALYSRVLGREGDDGGVATHSTRLADGRTTRAELIAHFLDSDEFLNNDRIVSVVDEGESSSDKARPEPVTS